MTMPYLPLDYAIKRNPDVPLWYAVTLNGDALPESYESERDARWACWFHKAEQQAR